MFVNSENFWEEKEAETPRPEKQVQEKESGELTSRNNSNEIPPEGFLEKTLPPSTPDPSSAVPLGISVEPEKKKVGKRKKGKKFLVVTLFFIIFLGILGGVYYGTVEREKEQFISGELLSFQASFLISDFFDGLKTTTDSLNQTLASLEQTKGELSEAYSSLEKKKEEIQNLQIEVNTLNRVTQIDSVIQYDLFQALSLIGKGLEAIDYGLYYTAENYLWSAIAYMQEAVELEKERERLLGW